MALEKGHLAFRKRARTRPSGLVGRLWLLVTSQYKTRVGHNHTFISIQCTYGIFSREITMDTVIYGANIRLWPTLKYNRIHILQGGVLQTFCRCDL